MGGFTPYEKCNMLCINRLQFHSPIYSAGGRATGKGTGKVTGKGAEIGVGKRCGWDVLQGIIYPSRRLQTQGCRAPFSDRH